MKRLIISLLATVSMLNLYSQNQDIAYPHVTPMTPNAAELAKYADYPVSYYTGTPNTSITLYEIDVDGFKLPISLNYHASGIRVDQEATWVGLGWSLDAESRISRTINATDDFMKGKFDKNYPYCEKGFYFAPDIGTNFDNQYRREAVDDPLCATLGKLEDHLIYDPEPDIFYYNLPGMNGKFILDKSRGAVLFDKSHNLKIEIIEFYASSEIHLKITDKEGNQYFYNQTEITENYSGNSALNKNLHTYNTKYDDNITSYVDWMRLTGTFCGDEDQYLRYRQTPDPLRTSWCINKIITKNGREINFTYDAEMQYLPTHESSENYINGTQSWHYYYRSKVVNTALRLKSIQGDFGRIDFNCSDRYDIKGSSQKLDAISIYNSTNTLIKSFKFDYGYFNDDYSGDPLYTHVFKRLKLNKVTEYSAANPSSPLNGGHLFEYFQGSFPSKNSKNVDYWGFQNGKSYGENYYIGLKINNVNYSGVRKDANFEKTIIGTLKKITYPTGGTAEFKYEGHKISSGYFETHTYEPLAVDNSNSVKYLPVFNNYSTSTYDQYPTSEVYSFQIDAPTTLKITCSLENTTGLVDTNYSYQNATVNPLGKLRKINPATNTLYTYPCPHIYDATTQYSQGQGSEIALTDKEFTLDVGTYEFTAYTPPKNVLTYWTLLYQNVLILTPGIPTDPYTGGGIRISEIKTDAKIRKFTYPYGNMLVEPSLYYIGTRFGIPDYISGCTVQVSESRTPLSTFNRGNAIGYDWVEEYTTDEEDDDSTIRTTFYNDNESERFDDNYPNSPVYINYTNGLAKSIEKFTDKYDVKILVEKEDLIYTSTYSNLIKAFKDRNQLKNTILDFYYKVEWPLQSQVIKTEKTDDGKSIVSETNYSYNSKDLLQSTSYNVNNSTITEKVKYPFEFINDPVSVAMTAKNMIGIPIEAITIKDNIVTQGRKTEYFENSGLYLPKTIYKTEFDAPVSETNFSNSSTSFYKPFLSFDSYNTNGNLLQFKQTNGIPTYYIWGYKEQYPIVKLENFTATDAANIQSFVTAAINASNADTTPALEDTLRTILTSLRNAAPNAMVTTYTYDPLIGVTSITDPKGYITYYKYDEFNRLKQVVDADGHIVGKNEYNYKQ